MVQELAQTMLLLIFSFFTVDTNTATIGGVKGGGIGCSVGPVTLSA